MTVRFLYIVVATFDITHKLRRGNGRHRWRSAEKTSPPLLLPPQALYKLVPCLVRFPRRDTRGQYRGDKHGQSITNGASFPSLRIFVSPRGPPVFTATGGEGNFKPEEGGRRKKVTLFFLSPRYRSIEFESNTFLRRW